MAGRGSIYQSDLGDLHFDLVAQGIGLDDTVNDGLVVQDLAGGNSSGAAVLNSIDEGAQLLVEQVAGGLQRNLGAGVGAGNGLVDLQRLVVTIK